MSGVDKTQVDALCAKLRREAEESGYHISPDDELVRDLAEGLLVNRERYGYSSCPCRLAAGVVDEDRDIVCPCDYRDPDLDQYGCCYCSLYVSEEIALGEKKSQSIPERRPPTEQRRAAEADTAGNLGEGLGSLSHPVWRCDVCGYLCARDHPPGVCPICKAKKDRFSRFA